MPRTKNPEAEVEMVDEDPLADLFDSEEEVPPTPRTVKKTKTRKQKGPYTVTVAGEYWSTEGKAKTPKPYVIEVKLPSTEAALSVIKNTILETAVKAKYEGVIGVRTHEIVSIVNDSDPAEGADTVEYMDRPALLQYILNEELPVRAMLFPGLVELRAAIRDCERSEKSFVAWQEDYEQKHIKQIELNHKLRQLNPELFTTV